jgi:hypothetical protein
VVRTTALKVELAALGVWAFIPHPVIEEADAQSIDLADWVPSVDTARPWTYGRTRRESSLSL